MVKEVSFKNRDRFVQLGLAIANLRKHQGMSQEMLAEKADISRSFLSSIEAPGTTKGFSVEVLYDIADALHIEAHELLKYAALSEQILIKKE